MSGGFDSSFTAYLLKKQGYNVIGVTFQLLSPAQAPTDHIARARKTADYLSIPHHVLDLSKDFQEQVVNRFIDEYKAGNTPNPCVFCNRTIKFGAFAERAFSLGADKIATGHYANVVEENGEYLLKKGCDRTKDQSYFLYPIKKDILKRTLFPLGLYHKAKLKEEARDLPWVVPSLKESQDICFIPGNDYRTFLAPYIPIKKGPIYHASGKRLGEHEGLHLYTIGQRKGLGIPFSEPLYVVGIIPAENAIVVGNKEELKRKTVWVSEINMISKASSGVKGRVRYRQKEEPCTYEVKDGLLRADFESSITSVTCGQSLVLYHEDILIGGGIIQKSL